MNSTKLTIPELEAILQNYRVEIELVPYRGCIDYTGKKITINPAFDMAETLVHETLHHYTNGTCARPLRRWCGTYKYVSLQKITCDNTVKRYQAGQYSAWWGET